MHLEQRFIFLISICAASSKPWEQRLNYVPNAFKVAEHWLTWIQSGTSIEPGIHQPNTTSKVCTVCVLSSFSDEKQLGRERKRPIEICMHGRNLNFIPSKCAWEIASNVFYVVVIFMFGLKSASSHSLCNNYIFRIYTVKSMWTIVWISLFHLPRHTHTNTYMSIFHRDTPCDVQLLCWNHDSVPCWVSVCFVCFELDWTKWNCFHFIELQSFELQYIQ